MSGHFVGQQTPPLGSSDQRVPGRSGQTVNVDSSARSRRTNHYPPAIQLKNFANSKTEAYKQAVPNLRMGIIDSFNAKSSLPLIFLIIKKTDKIGSLFYTVLKARKNYLVDIEKKTTKLSNAFIKPQMETRLLVSG